MKRKHEENNLQDLQKDDTLDIEDDAEKERENLTKIKYIEQVQIGKIEMDTWYFSPYPNNFGRCKKLYICEFCLKYMELEKTYRYHKGECAVRHPPGKKIYKKNQLEVYEIDGAEQVK